MRVSTVSLLLAGGALALGACSTSGEPINLTQAQRAEICGDIARYRITPTGRQTGEVRRDYECSSVHGGGYSDSRDRNIPNGSAARSSATSRALGGN